MQNAGIPRRELDFAGMIPSPLVVLVATRNKKCLADKFKFVKRILVIIMWLPLL